jgi:hypothetical protein
MGIRVRDRVLLLLYKREEFAKTNTVRVMLGFKLFVKSGENEWDIEK